MSENLMIMFNVFAVFGSIVLVIKILSDNRIRQKAAEKGLSKEDFQHLFAKESEQFLSGLNALKWGMVLVGIGLAVIAGRFVSYDVRDEVTFGLVFVMAGVAFIIYYAIYKRTESN
jgi:hypothetical protein